MQADSAPLLSMLIFWLKDNTGRDDKKYDQEHYQSAWCAPLQYYKLEICTDLDAHVQLDCLNILLFFFTMLCFV